MSAALFRTLAAALLPLLASAADPVSYSRQIRPMLDARCISCHSDDDRNGGLSMEGYDHVMDAVVAGKPEDSRLYKVISGESPRMPKGPEKLSEEQVTAVRLWIEQGAKNDTAAAAPGKVAWWSSKPLAKPAASGIDTFIRAKLAEKRLTPSPEADRRTLIRRLTYNLHGLPPTPDETDAFLADKAPNAYEKLVDRLLASPRYGERWARHWLDVVHYGDSHGYDKDKPRANAWPYRDYVIRAFNQDKPYARFVEEQLAGDVLFPDDPDGTIATGFIAAGPWDFVGQQELREGTTDKNITRLLDRDDMVAQTMSTFVSQTVHCARCHNHKFDPIKQEDYYSVQSVFAGIDRADRPVDSDPKIAQARRELTRQKRAVQLKLQPLLDKVDDASSAEIDKLSFRISDAKMLSTHIGEPKNEKDAAEKKRLLAQADADTKVRKLLIDALVGEVTYAEIARLTEAAKALDAKLAELPKPQLVYAATSFFNRAGTFRPALEPRIVNVLNRGNITSPMQEAAPGAIGVRFPVADPNDEGARRAALAHWITAKDNALAWRSIVNRVWHYHFGAGIVDSPSDFGRMGSEPTHPELLDWLAVWFRDDAGGSLKKLHKLIVMSETYRQTSANHADGAGLDAENRYLWRMNRGKLDAESLRDSMLLVAGKLDLTMGGPSARQFWFKDDHSPIYDYAKFDPDSPEAYRRSIYRFVVRSVPDPFMDRLDCPDPSALTPKRNNTLTAIQALALLNNPFVIRMAEHFAERVAAKGSPDEQIREAYRLAFGRAPSATENTRLTEFAARNGMPNTCRLLLNSNEFIFSD